MTSFVRTIRISVLAALCAAVLVPQAMTAEPIVGIWKLPNGILIESSERNGQYCGTVISGEFKGRSIGCVNPGTDGQYRGSVVKVKDGKRFRGHASVQGNVLTVTGCVLFILCKSEKLTRHTQSASNQ